MRNLIAVAAALLLAFILASCSGDTVAPVADSHTAAFTLTDDQIAQFVASPEPDWHNDVASSGDHLSAIPYFVGPFTTTAPKSAPPASGSKSVSTTSGGYKYVWNAQYSCWTCNGWYWYNNCWNCNPPKCGCTTPCVVKTTGITATGLGKFQADCDHHCADVIYKVHVSFTQCPNQANGAAGHVVVFYRNGVEVGRANTDANGDASFTDKCLPAACYSIKAVIDCYSACWCVTVCQPDCCKVHCTGITCSGNKTFEADCDKHCADVSYKVHVTYTQCPDPAAGGPGGHEVVFYRNGSEVGRSNTDNNGDAGFSETCLPGGDYDIKAKTDDCETTFKVTVHQPDCCEVVCTGLDNLTDRFIAMDCFAADADVPVKVHMNFNQCPNKPFDPSGMEVVFTGDGTEIGRANTDSNGDASFVWHHVGFGNHHIVASSNHCGAEFDVTLYDDCTRHACLNGRGKIAGKTDPYMVFSYETHVNAGVLEMANTMSLTDGPESFTNVPVEWVVVLNTEVYFGNDHIVFHTIDNGKAPGVDYIEVWDTQTGYYNSGTLLNGQIRTSWGIYKPGDPHKAMP